MNTAYESDGMIYVPQTTYLNNLEKKKKEKQSPPQSISSPKLIEKEPLSPSDELKKAIPRSIRKTLLPEMIDIWHETSELLGNFYIITIELSI
jgi:hypothetical protein